MKTRVIQDQPEQGGSSGKAPLDLASAQMQRAMNIAGRMGAWSAGHWKTAVFGWLACVVVFFYVGNALVGLKQIELNDAGVGQSSGPLVATLGSRKRRLGALTRSYKRGLLECNKSGARANFLSLRHRYDRDAGWRRSAE